MLFFILLLVLPVVESNSTRSSSSSSFFICSRFLNLLFCKNYFVLITVSFFPVHVWDYSVIWEIKPPLLCILRLVLPKYNFSRGIKRGILENWSITKSINSLQVFLSRHGLDHKDCFCPLSDCVSWSRRYLHTFIQTNDKWNFITSFRQSLSVVWSDSDCR